MLEKNECSRLGARYGCLLLLLFFSTVLKGLSKCNKWAKQSHKVWRKKERKREGRTEGGRNERKRKNIFACTWHDCLCEKSKNLPKKSTENKK